MIAYFKKDGRINPIKFRIEEENKCQVIKIGKIISTDLEKLCSNKRCWCLLVVLLLERLRKCLSLSIMLMGVAGCFIRYINAICRML